MRLYELLSEQRDGIVRRFVGEIERHELAPEGIARSLLADHIPKFLDDIVLELGRIHEVRASQDVLDSSTTAQRHGDQRWSLGYDLQSLIREYGILRHCILAAARDAGASVEIDEFDVLSKCLNVGIAEAATAFAEQHDAELRAQKESVEFLAEAGQILTSSLDLQATLTRLARLTIPRLGDWCAVYVEDGRGIERMPVAHVDPSKVEVLLDLFRRIPPPSPSTDVPLSEGNGTVLVEGVPTWMEEAIAADPPHLELFRSIRPTSCLLVPIRFQNTVLGTLVCGISEKARRFSPSDVTLAEELARRAAVAIDNARLYELSQHERALLEEASRAKDEFVALISHELRTPLSAILGWSRMLRGGGVPEETRDHALDVIERNASAQDQLVGDLLDASRIISGKIRLHFAQVDLSDVVALVIEGLRPTVDAKRIRLTADLASNVGTIRGDGDRIQQVVWNLLTNAVKFTPKGGEILVSLHRADSNVELVVEDTGVGIAPEFLSNVFERFRQADEGTTRRHMGLGLGLSIARHLAELHGGSISARSAGVGLGATFVATLPISALASASFDAPSARVTTSPPNADPSASSVQGVRLLVVDDEADARDLLQTLLGMYGMIVETAASAAEAMERLKEFQPDAIISDIGMPEEDGYKLIRKIRTTADEDRKNIPAIALTAFARKEDRMQALVAGFNAHLTKPVDPATLIAMIADLVGRTTPRAR
jgi:signal transduction histidine kinase/ActR/RegA family two-component response regulator